jgi:hypothetical protein
VITSDPHPLSLRRILTRLNLTSLRKAMTQSAPFKLAGSMASWMTNVAAQTGTIFGTSSLRY